jgi:GST-like protein
MIDLYTFETKNGIRPVLAFEECGLDYRIHWVDLFKNEHRGADYLAINPEGRIPAAVIESGGKRQVIVQSAAILLWAAQTTGRFLPVDPDRRRQVDNWLLAGMSDLAASSSALNAVENRIPDATEATRVYFRKRFFEQLGIVERRLGEGRYLAGEFSVADLALFPVIDFNTKRYDPADHPNVIRWHADLIARPAIARGLQRLRDARTAASG